MEKKLQKLRTGLLTALLAAGVLWLCLRYVLRWAAPFLLAFALASLMEPAVGFLHRRGWRRSAAAGLLSLLLLGLLLWALAALSAWAVSAAGELARRLPAMMQGLGRSLDALEERALAVMDASSGEAAATMRTALDAVGELLTGLPARLSRGALDLVARAAQGSPDVLLWAATAGIGTYFCSAGYPRVTAFLAAQLPEKARRRLGELGQDLRGSCGGYLRAQLLLMALTFFELLAAFWLLGIPGPAGAAALTALVDALPVFGAGTVLGPWALYALLLGQTGRGLGLLITWAAVSLVRSGAQAKLLGDQIGLDPLASLMAVYVGWRIWRVWGMLLFPLLLATLCQLNERGVLRLWKN